MIYCDKLIEKKNLRKVVCSEKQREKGQEEKKRGVKFFHSLRAL